MTPVVRLPLSLRHVCSTPSGEPVRGLLLDREAVVLTRPAPWGGVCFKSLTGASRFISGKPYAGGRSFVFALDAVGPAVAALLAPLVKGELAAFRGARGWPGAGGRCGDPRPFSRGATSG